MTTTTALTAAAANTNNTAAATGIVLDTTPKDGACLQGQQPKEGRLSACRVVTYAGEDFTQLHAFSPLPSTGVQK